MTTLQLLLKKKWQLMFNEFISLCLLHVCHVSSLSCLLITIILYYNHIFVLTWLNFWRQNLCHSKSENCRHNLCNFLKEMTCIPTYVQHFEFCFIISVLQVMMTTYTHTSTVLHFTRSSGIPKQQQPNNI